jgi:glutathione S-transferase
MKLYYAPTSPYIAQEVMMLEGPGNGDVEPLINCGHASGRRQPDFVEEPALKVPALQGV